MCVDWFGPGGCVWEGGGEGCRCDEREEGGGEVHVWQSEWVWDFVGDDNVRLAGLKMDQAGSESFLTAVAVPDFL